MVPGALWVLHQGVVAHLHCLLRGTGASSVAKPCKINATSAHNDAERWEWAGKAAGPLHGGTAGRRRAVLGRSVGWPWVLVCRFPFAPAQHSAPLPALLQATGSAAQPQQQNFELAQQQLAAMPPKSPAKKAKSVKQVGCAAEPLGEEAAPELSLASCSTAAAGLGLPARGFASVRQHLKWAALA